MNRIFTHVAGKLALYMGRPIAFIAATLSVVIWAALGPVFDFSEVWQLVINTGTTIITFLMIFLVQNTQNRDASAMQAKLDELLLAIDNARSEFIGIEHLTDEEIDEIRAHLEQQCDGATKGRPPHEAVQRLQGRK